MLSYQHSYHAGNLADVHKHAVLAVMLTYLIQKDKPLSYIETHAGKGLYDLKAPEAQKTEEAKAGILSETVMAWFAEDHPYHQVITSIKARFGQSAYAGSPMIASEILRANDVMHLAEWHPAEHQALAKCLGTRAHLYREDGFCVAERLCPPMPRRGVMMVDPSYEVDSDYVVMPGFLSRVMSKWNVGVLVIWYPLLVSGREQDMVHALSEAVPHGLHHQVRFPSAREGHRMVGSGLFIVRMPYGLADELDRLSQCFAMLSPDQRSDG